MRVSELTNLCERWAFELHHVAFRVRHIDGRTFAFRTEALLNGASFIAMARKVIAQGRLVGDLAVQRVAQLHEVVGEQPQPGVAQVGLEVEAAERTGDDVGDGTTTR